MTENIFIHIPKTGGTTVNVAMNDSYWQTEPGYYYRHILPDKSSNAGDIFNMDTNDEYLGKHIMMMLRNPLDRITSEYHFIREREEFMKLLRPKPRSFQSYIGHNQTPNYVTGFLVGKKMYDTSSPTARDLDNILKSIEKLDIKVGIFENFSQSLAYFSKGTTMEWKKVIEKKRVTFRRPDLKALTPTLVDKFNETNGLDIELYNYSRQRFDEEAKGLSLDIEFVGDKYDHVVPYAARACFYEFCLENKSMIKWNFQFFKGLTFYMINQLQIRDGREFATIWNKTFVNHFQHAFPNSELLTVLLSEECHDEDPIEEAFKIGSAIDNYLEKYPHHRFANMVFNPGLIVK